MTLSHFFIVGLLFLKNANDDDSWLFIILSVFPFLFCIFIDAVSIVGCATVASLIRMGEKFGVSFLLVVFWKVLRF